MTFIWVGKNQNGVPTGWGVFLAVYFFLLFCYYEIKMKTKQWKLKTLDMTRKYADRLLAITLQMISFEGLNLDGKLMKLKVIWFVIMLIVSASELYQAFLYMLLCFVCRDNT